MIDKLIFQELTDAEAANLTGGNLPTTLQLIDVTPEPTDPPEAGEVPEAGEEEYTARYVDPITGVSTQVELSFP